MNQAKLTLFEIERIRSVVQEDGSAPSTLGALSYYYGDISKKYKRQEEGIELRVRQGT